MKTEIIVEAGAEGGSLTLYGQRNGRGWLYSRHLVDHIAWMSDEGPWIEHDSEVVSTWAAALKLLDKYHFNHLYPLKVHPDFRSKVLKAVLSRNIRDHDESGADRWHEVCGLPRLDDLKIEMFFQEIQIPRFGSTQGRLLAANPAFSKPSNITKEQWALCLLHNFRNQNCEKNSDEDWLSNKYVLAVPSSILRLCAGEYEKLEAYAKSEGIEYIVMRDDWNGPRDYDFAPPMESMQQIIDNLRRGNDVIILSQTKTISDFVPAVLHLVADEHNSHPAKLWCSIAQDVGVELTEFQRGYVYGLMNVNDPFGLEQLRNARRADIPI